MLGTVFREAGHRPAWLLLGGLALVCAVLVVLNTLVLARLVPTLAWGPQPAWATADPAQGPWGRGRALPDATMRALIRQEILWATEIRGDSQAAERLRRGWRVRPVGGVSGQTPTAVGRGTAEPTSGERLAPQPASFLMPFGIHRSGLQGVGLYGVALVSFMAVSGLLAFCLPARLRVVRGALLGGGVRHLARLAALGALAYGLLLLLGLFLTVLVVGAPIAALLLFALVPATLFGLVAVGLALGRGLVRATRTQPATPLIELAAGTLALFAAGILPFLGWLVLGVAAVLGMGALILTRLGSGAPWSLHLLEEKEFL
ncbi:MAG: hypothetical protein HY689_04475 [Chloroflexi bacterium]|nr:hypothetical protein [Chloroflexota bacterium]